MLFFCYFALASFLINIALMGGVFILPDHSGGGSLARE